MKGGFLPVFIKEHPEDFRVEERIHLPWSPNPGPFRLYRLIKRSWNTVDALRAATDATGVPFHTVRFVGRKDRHACTTQYCTVPASLDLSFRRQNVTLEFLGFTEEPLNPHHLQGNRFDITARGLQENQETTLEERWQETLQFGSANYFDDQRFGELSSSGRFFAEHVIRRDWSGALRTYLTACHPDAPPAVQRRKKSMDRLWNKWHALARHCVTPREKEMVAACSRIPGDLGIQKALECIPREEWGMFCSSFQSALWNEAAALLVQRHGIKVFRLPGKERSLLMFRAYTENSPLPHTRIPMPAPALIDSQEEGARALWNILGQHALHPDDFRLPANSKAYFGSFDRPVVVFPQEASLQITADDRHQGCRKALFSFFLPPGSYATLLVRSLEIPAGGCIPSSICL